MPLYEFACADCGKVFESIRRLSDTEAPPCPQCGSTNTQKKISGFKMLSGQKKVEAGTPGRGFT